MPPFDQFEKINIEVQSDAVGQVSIALRRSVKEGGKAVLLLHGYPQSSYLWNRVAPALSERYTVIAADLRGYGSSSKPRGSETHVEYSKREMARDMVLVMRQLGYDKFDIIAHDRGARVAHRLVLDHPGTVDRLMVLDITPTLSMYENTDMQFAAGYWHWFFLIQPSPFPENVILADPKAFWALNTSKVSHKNMIWSERDIEEYQKDFFKPETVHALISFFSLDVNRSPISNSLITQRTLLLTLPSPFSPRQSCEDYRAAATTDLEHDRHDRSNGKRLQLEKLRVLWGAKGMIERLGKVVETWKQYSSDGVDVSGRSYDCGHYIPEEVPDEVIREVFEFLG